MCVGEVYARGGCLWGGGFALDCGQWVERSAWGMSLGFSGGPGWGVYRDDMTNAKVMRQIREQMSGNTYLDHEMPEKTNGGFYFSGRALLMRQFKNTAFKIAVGPRVNYFLKQELDVLTQSQDGNSIIDEYTQIPYTDGQFIPGLEINMTFIDAFSLKYAQFAKRDDLTPMQSIGITFNVNFISYASY